ncbi:MAG: hypothetical protein APR53_02420 [Methanoculleus sp. SDB]|nr:MAG: hypothetical protein APR53_02420 [Methanoculleus sp. SDB]
MAIIIPAPANHPQGYSGGEPLTENLSGLEIAVGTDLYRAFLEACLLAGEEPADALAALLLRYIDARAGESVRAEFDRGMTDEEFAVDIKCDDPLCTRPQIRMRGSGNKS